MNIAVNLWVKVTYKINKMFAIKFYSLPFAIITQKLTK